MMLIFLRVDCGDYSDYDLGSSLMEFPKLVKAALSCSTLKVLSTNIPFTVSRNAVPPNLEVVKFQYSGFLWDEDVLSDCLCCIADMCRRPSMQFLDVCYSSRIRSSEPVSDRFLVILNRSLHCNPSFRSLNLHIHMSANYQRATFSDSLQTHPSLFPWNMSKSFDDLSLSDSSTAAHDALEPEGEVAIGCVLGSVQPKNRESFASVWIGSRWQSCPDLRQIQSLHNMHPLLHQALNMCTTHLYYCKKQFDVHRRLFGH